MPTPEPTLRRTLGFWMLLLYGLGTTVGGGIYVLVGRVADRAGYFAPLSFLIAALLIVFTALSFAELSARYPESAGEAIYIRHGFGRRDLAVLVGILVIVAGLVSSAALAHGFAGYLRSFVDVPSPFIVTTVVLLVGVVAAWGIGESVGVAALITVVEIGGLMVVIWSGLPRLPNLVSRLADAPSLAGLDAWAGILAGSFLAFYAFIGFEDMVNVAEEVKDPERTLPRAIVATLALTTILYFAVAVVTLAAVPLDELRRSEAPLLLVVEQRYGAAGGAFGIVGMFAVLNGVLIQMIMASRVLYGMARERWINAMFGRVHPVTRTPLLATAASVAAILLLALAFPIDVLAEITSFLVLVVASLVNAALVRLKRRTLPRAGSLSLPTWVPVSGLAASLAAALLILRNLLA